MSDFDSEDNVNERSSLMSGFVDNQSYQVDENSPEVRRPRDPDEDVAVLPVDNVRSRNNERVTCLSCITMHNGHNLT